MTNWSASLDKPFAVEQTNLVAYVTFTNGTQTIPGVRIPSDSEKNILAFVARECQRLDAVDVRVAAMNAALAAATVVPGPIALPDISKQAAFDTANATLLQKLGDALTQKQITDTTPIDPTIPAAFAAQQAALAALK